MKLMVVLCLVTLLVGAVQAQSGRGRKVPREASNHLDVGLPDALLGDNSPLLIHLKDQGLWDKENGAERGPSRASLLPSILKSIMDKQNQEDSPDFEDEEISMSKAAIHSPQMMIRNLVDEEQLPDLEDLEEMVNDDELAKNLYASEKSEDKIHFYFKLRDALKNAYSNEKGTKTQGSKGLRSQVGGDGGVRFNLEDLETELKEKFPGAKNIDLGSGDVNEKEILVSLVELLKEYVAEETETPTEPQSVEETKATEEVDAATANARVLEQLRRSDVSVNQVDNTGGIFFTLGDGQGSAEATTEE